MASKYLTVYMNIFAAPPGAQHLSTHYVDAFDGTGFRSTLKDSSATFLFESTEAQQSATRLSSWPLRPTRRSPRTAADVSSNLNPATP